MPTDEVPVIKYRLDQLEKLSVDHEDRIRAIEVVAVKIGVYAFLGSLVGGAAAYAIASRLFGG